MPQASQRRKTRSQKEGEIVATTVGRGMVGTAAAVKPGTKSKQTTLTNKNSTQPICGASKVIYLEPTDYGKPIPNHPAEVGKLLHDNGFTKCSEIQKFGKFQYKMELQESEDMYS